MAALSGRATPARDIVRGARIVFWDFDGVIKESVDVKTAAFVALFAPYGADVAEQVRRHHLAHGGMSRFEKIPIYLQYAGVDASEPQVRALCDAFGERVRQAVIDAPWVAGAEQYLRTRPGGQLFAVLSATPHHELARILTALQLGDCFDAAVGAPTPKSAAVQLILADHGLSARDAAFIGDARADLDAATVHGIPFVLRRHATNADVFADYDGPSIEDLTAL